MSAQWLAPRAYLARTASGSAELSRPSRSLSVPQRKMLQLIQPGINYESLMTSGAPEERSRRDRDLVRLFDLGLVIVVDAGGNPVDNQPESGPVTVFGPLTKPGAPIPKSRAGNEAATTVPLPKAPFPEPVARRSSPLPLILVAAVVLAALLAWWFLAGAPGRG